MKKRNSIPALLFISAIILSGIQACSITEGMDSSTGTSSAESLSGQGQAVIPDAPLPLSNPEYMPAKFSATSHVNMTGIAASYWGLPTSRINNIKLASDDPDTYQSGFENGYNQQKSHAYMYSFLNIWGWGDANQDYRDNLDKNGGEGYQGHSASYYYGLNNQSMGDKYIGFACHYIEDVSFVLHTTLPTVFDITMLSKHFAFEDWMKNNWSEGHCFMNSVKADGYYYAVTDPEANLKQAAWWSSYWNEESDGCKAWKAYKSSGYPTAAGTGNADLVRYTRSMHINAARWARGTIKYALDKYGQWSSKY